MKTFRQILEEFESSEGVAVGTAPMVSAPPRGISQMLMRFKKKYKWKARNGTKILESKSEISTKVGEDYVKTWFDKSRHQYITKINPKNMSDFDGADFNDTKDSALFTHRSKVRSLQSHQKTE